MGTIRKVNRQVNGQKLHVSHSENDLLKNGFEKDDFQQKNFVGKHHYSLVSSPSLPNFLADNEFLLHQHRPAIPTFQACARSIFHIHTETINIWTHLIGSSCMILLMVYYLLLPTVSWTQKAWFMPFFLGSIICMGFSAIFHSFNCHSPTAHSLLAKLDYCGIIVLIVASFPPWLHYGFYCQTTTKMCYLFFILGLGFLSIIAVMSDKFATPDYRAIRAALFMALGLSGLFPGLHYFYIAGFYHSLHYGSWLIIMATWFLIGGFMYAIRVPERLKPGTFDIVGQSHQILHICVMFGVLSCYIGLTRLAAFRITEDDLCLVS